MIGILTFSSVPAASIVNAAIQPSAQTGAPNPGIVTGEVAAIFVHGIVAPAKFGPQSTNGLGFGPLFDPLTSTYADRIVPFEWILPLVIR